MTDVHEEARYAQVLRFPSRQELLRRLPPLVLGLFVIGFSIAISVRARLGLAPWDVLHQGIAKTRASPSASCSCWSAWSCSSRGSRCVNTSGSGRS